MRINNGDPLEIYTNDNQVIFQKYSGVENMVAAVNGMLGSLYRKQKMPVIACDKDKVVAVKGIGKKEIVNRRITADFAEIMERRRVFAYNGNDGTLCFPVEGVERYAIACAPIVASGDVAGAILYLSMDNARLSPASETQIALVEFLAEYLGEQLGD